MKPTLVAKVMDQPGVLNRVASLFRRRAFNIESLTVGHTETPDVSRMTIVVDTAKAPAPIVAANLRKLIAPVNPDLEVCCTPLRIGSKVRIPRALLVRRDEPPCDVAATQRPAVTEPPAPPSLPDVIPPDAFGLPQAAPIRTP